jgi:alpha,alpha-trehalase
MRTVPSIVRRRLIVAVCAIEVACTLIAGPSQSLPDDSHLQRLRGYIKMSWTTLSRSIRDLPQALPDPKIPRKPGQPWLLYISPRESRTRVQSELADVLDASAMKDIEIRTLPRNVLSIREHGLLYLPRPYIVPGGRFNEMYGWDSYFIQVGLLRDDQLGDASDLVENFLYEIEHYGTILNANRTYFLSRSQPPFLTRMILAVYEKTRDNAWLRGTLPAIERYYRFWTTEPHTVPDAGLSRYFDRGEGPAPEVMADEKDEQGRTHYDRAREYYQTHDVTDYDESLYYDSRRDRLTDLFYKGDRSMRESGFDPSNRFGALNVDVIHYAPVCLNTLLYVMEDDTGRIMETLGDTSAATMWRSRAASRRDLINTLMWDEEAGLYYDYNFRTRQRRRYDFATTFLSVVGGNRIARPGRAASRKPVAVRSARRPADEHRGDWKSVGCAFRLGAAADDRRRWPAAIRISRGREPDRGKVRLAGREGIRRARHDRREIRCPPARVRRCRRHQVRVQRKPGWIRMDQRCGPRSPGRDAGAMTDLAPWTTTTTPVAHRTRFRGRRWRTPRVRPGRESCRTSAPTWRRRAATAG